MVFRAYLSHFDIRLLDNNSSPIQNCLFWPATPIFAKFAIAMENFSKLTSEASAWPNLSMFDIFITISKFIFRAGSNLDLH